MLSFSVVVPQVIHTSLIECEQEPWCCLQIHVELTVILEPGRRTACLSTQGEPACMSQVRII